MPQADAAMLLEAHEPSVARSAVVAQDDGLRVSSR